MTDGRGRAGPWSCTAAPASSSAARPDARAGRGLPRRPGPAAEAGAAVLRRRRLGAGRRRGGDPRPGGRPAVQRRPRRGLHRRGPQRAGRLDHGRRDPGGRRRGRRHPHPPPDLGGPRGDGALAATSCWSARAPTPSPQPGPGAGRPGLLLHRAPLARRWSRQLATPRPADPAAAGRRRRATTRPGRAGPRRGQARHGRASWPCDATATWRPAPPPAAPPASAGAGSATAR